MAHHQFKFWRRVWPQDRMPDHDYEDVLVAGEEPEQSQLSEYGD